jgi:demethylmenaquinone methyltransferase/2-methoxy-6-polyprenyl-1,4-benzoquinol methylase
MFSSTAGKYDLLNRLFSLGTDVRWRRELASEIPETENRPILDVATGTGDVALTLEERCSGDGLIVGTDFTLPMLQVGASKISDDGARRIRLTAGDAYALPLRSAEPGSPGGRTG